MEVSRIMTGLEKGNPPLLSAWFQWHNNKGLSSDSERQQIILTFRKGNAFLCSIWLARETLCH